MFGFPFLELKKKCIYLKFNHYFVLAKFGSKLPQIHGDLFNRLTISPCISENLILLNTDQALTSNKVEIDWKESWNLLLF